MMRSLKKALVFSCFYLFLHCASKESRGIPSANSVLKTTEKVANWQLKNTNTSNTSNELHWKNAVFYNGMFQLSQVSHYPKYINWLIETGERNGWKLDHQNGEAPDYTVSQFYLNIYQHPHLNRKKIIIPTQERLEAILTHPKEGMESWKSSEELYKKPLVWAKLSKINKGKSDEYLTHMDSMYHKTYSDLWDKKAQLFHDNTISHQANGTKVFSAQHNSLVFAGLALLISDLPKTLENKKFYTDIFIQMAQTLKKTQRKDGTWSSSLLEDQKEYQNSEMSTTSFYTFGIAWGINNGLLDQKKYAPILLKAWQSIAGKVGENGALRFSSNFKEYGSSMEVGSFLAAGSEMYTYINKFYPIDKSTSYTTFMKNGGWCWYQDPRALISNNKLIIGGVNGQNGNARLGVFDLDKERLDSTLILHKNLGADDHNVPALYKRPDKSILAVWAKHAKEKTHYFSISSPQNYLKWGDTQEFEHDYKARMGVTYMNLFYLKNQDKLYNFFRDGLNFNPSFITSKDQGETWGNRTHFISNDVKGFQRPYAKYLQIDENTIGISYTDAHPRNYGNNLYYATFSNNNFYTVDGTFIKSLDDGPLLSSSAERIYTGSSTKEKAFVNESVPNSAWTCTMAKDQNNNPHLGYTLYLKDSDLRFRINSWDGKKWNDREIAYAGKGLYKAESSYTGLLAFDPEDPTNVYISTDVNPSTGEDLGGNHEIYSAKIGPKDNISTIKWKALTSNSPHRNIRPIVVSDEGYKVVLWLYGPWHTFKNYDSDVVGIILEKPE